MNLDDLFTVRIRATRIDSTRRTSMIKRHPTHPAPHGAWPLRFGLALLVAASLFAISCGGDDDDVVPTKAGATTEATKAGATTAVSDIVPGIPDFIKSSPGGQLILNTKPAKRYKIGVALPNIQDPAYALQVVWAEKYAKLIGVDVTVVDARTYGESGRQAAQIEDMVQKGIQGIVLVPSDAAGAGPPVKAAIAKGVPVIEWITPDADKAYTAIVINDLKEIGRQMCAPLAKVNPKARVVMLTGPPAAETAILRAQGFKECAQQSGMTILAELSGPSARPDAQSKMEDMIQKFGNDIDGVMAFGSFMSLGAADAIKAGKLSHPVFITTAAPDGETVKRLKTGEVSAVVDQYLGIGVMTAMAATIAKLNGVTIPQQITNPIQSVTTAQAATYDWQWALPPE